MLATWEGTCCVCLTDGGILSNSYKNLGRNQVASHFSKTSEQRTFAHPCTTVLNSPVDARPQGDGDAQEQDDVDVAPSHEGHSYQSHKESVEGPVHDVPSGRVEAWREERIENVLDERSRLRGQTLLFLAIVGTAGRRRSRWPCCHSRQSFSTTVSGDVLLLFSQIAVR